MTSKTTKRISGQIAGVNLSSFLQMIEMEQKTCTINIVTKKNMGKIFFHNGTLIDAQTIHLKHLEALYDILAWKNIVIEVEENEFTRKDHINLPLLHILKESTRHLRSTPPDMLKREGLNIETSSERGKFRELQTASGKLEGRPVVGMRILLSGLELGVSQGAPFVILFQVFIKPNHKVAGRKVIDLPQAGHNRVTPGIEKSPGQSHQVIPVGNPAETGFTGAQGDEVRANPHRIEFIHGQHAV